MKQTLSFLALFLLVVFGHSPAATGTSQSSYTIFLPAIQTSLLPTIQNIKEPLLIDGAAGRLYAQTEVNGQWQTAVLSTVDGTLLDSYPYSGRLALDRNHHRLVVDQGESGVAVLDSLTGALLITITLPLSAEPSADPQLDPTSGLAYIFRENTVYLADVSTGLVTSSHTLSKTWLVCSVPNGDAPILHSYFDVIARQLHISFFTWSCTPFTSATIVTYESTTMAELGEFDVATAIDLYYQVVAYSGNLYGADSIAAYVLFNHYWAAHNGMLWFTDNSDSGIGLHMEGIVVDWGRGLLYEAVKKHDYGGPFKVIRVSLTTTRQLLHVVSINAFVGETARLAGHDPHIDNLYFIENGQLIVLPATAVVPVE